MIEIEAICDSLSWRIIIYVMNNDGSVFEMSQNPRESKPVKTAYILFSTKFKHYMSARPTSPKYQLLEQIGQGEFGIIHKALNNYKNVEVAVKVIPLEKFQNQPGLVECAELEKEILSRVNHPHIIKLLDFSPEPSELCIFYELCQNGTLEDKIRNGRLPGEECLKILFQLFNAFEVLHNLSVVHRDVKTENILIHNDVCKLADFGFCQRLNPNGKISGLAGTIPYLAPEIVFHVEEYDEM